MRYIFINSFFPIQFWWIALKVNSLFTYLKGPKSFNKGTQSAKRKLTYVNKLSLQLWCAAFSPQFQGQENPGSRALSFSQISMHSPRVKVQDQDVKKSCSWVTCVVIRRGIIEGKILSIKYFVFPCGSFMNAEVGKKGLQECFCLFIFNEELSNRHRTTDQKQTKKSKALL